MSAIRTVLSELLALFVDDGSLVLAVIAWAFGGAICVRAHLLDPRLRSGAARGRHRRLIGRKRRPRGQPCLKLRRSMIGYLWIGLGGALGSMGRAWLALAVARLTGPQFPWGTILINITVRSSSASSAL